MTNPWLHIPPSDDERHMDFPSVDQGNFDIIEAAYSYNISSRDKREIRKVIFDHFEHIEEH